MNREIKQFDLIVIGSGGGMMVATAAARKGFRTALIERGPLGGTCLNRGCIPSKMIIYPGELANTIRRAANINIEVSEPEINFSDLVQRISTTVAEIREGIVKSLADLDGLERFEGSAVFESNHVIRVCEARLSAPRIVVATGAEPDIPSIPGLAGTPYMTSTEALSNPILPDRLIVVGAGYIAVELGYAYGAAGSKVEYIVRSRFLRQEDDEISQHFNRIYTQRHKCHMGAQLRSVEYDGSIFTLKCDSTNAESRTVRGDAILVCTGIKPATRELGLENTDIRVDDAGHILVDSTLQSDAPGVYALGDVVGNHLFRHTANYEAAYLVRHLISGEPIRPLDYGPVPHAIFSHPEIAGVGLREQDVAEYRNEIAIGRSDFAESNAGIARGYREGFAKIIVHRSDHLILGCQIMGHDAATLLHMMIPLLKSRATLNDMLDLIFIHPALPEILRDAARDALTQLK